MLNINLLSARFDAERQYRKMCAGDPCDYLTMLEDRTVRRRVHQGIRNRQTRAIKRAARIKEKVDLQLSHRKGMSAVGSTIGFLGTNGQPNRDGKGYRGGQETTDDRDKRRIKAAKEYASRGNSPFKTLVS